MSKKLLLIAYHFPPIQGSTGVTRTLSHVKYLREHGWSVTVLTVHPRAYPAVFNENIQLIPEQTLVERAFALDAQKHLSIAGKYLQIMSLPDRWQSWILGGVFSGLRIIRRWRPDVVMSTYPIASAHCIGFVLNKLTGVPWVAEMRDPMAQENYPTEPLAHRAYELVERRIFKQASHVIVTTPGCADTYEKKFPAFPASRISVITNGYDPEMFPAVQNKGVESTKPAKVVLLHSGLLYPHERNPQWLFEALAELKYAGEINAAGVSIHFRASGHEQMYQAQVAELNIQDIVKFLPSVPYREALEEMISADILLLLQAENCNEQIPAKLYEYLYCARPIIGLVHPDGDAARVLEDLGIEQIAALEDKQQIKERLLAGIAQYHGSCAVIPAADDIEQFSRKNLTAKLATVLDGIAGATTRATQS